MSRCAATTFQDSGDMREDDPMQRERTWVQCVFQVDAVFNFDQRFIAFTKYIHIYIYVYNMYNIIYLHIYLFLCTTQSNICIVAHINIPFM